MLENPKDKVCFVICPIGEEGSPTRDQSNKVFRHLITPPAQQAGYTPKRADHLDRPGIITSQVIEHVIEAPLVIADLTDRNPNVFYELAIRHAVKKPLIQLINRKEQIPFDVASTRIIKFDLTDPDSVERAKEEIANQIQSLHTDDSPIDNPISTALDLKALKRSEDPKDRSLGEVIAAIRELRDWVAESMSQHDQELAYVHAALKEMATHQIAHKDLVDALTFELARSRAIQAHPNLPPGVQPSPWSTADRSAGVVVTSPDGIKVTRQKLEERARERRPGG